MLALGTALDASEGLHMTDLRASEDGLEPNVLGLPSLIMQSISFVAPAVSVLLTFQLIAGFAGIASPFALAVVAVIILMLAISLAQLARQMPSAGGYFTYVSRAVGARAGFMTGWTFSIYAPIAPGFLIAFTAYVIEQAVKAQYGFRIPWWATLIVVVAIVWFIVARGIRLSVETMIALSMCEIVIVLVLALWGLLEPGRGGFTFSPFSPASAPNFHGLYLGVVFSVFAFAGWEGSVPLAEESRRADRNIPFGLVISVLLLGVIFLFTSWGLMVGWGVHSLPSLIGSTQLPPIVLAQRYWGDAWVLVPLALLNSIISASVSSFNTTTRMWFAISRAGLLPASWSRVHPRFHTPTHAVAAQALLVLAIGLGFGLWLGPTDAFLTLSLVTTLALIFIYISGNLGVFLFYRRERPDEFRWLAHLLFPLVSAAAVAWAGLKALDPLPAAPIRWAPVGVAVWMVLGLILLAVLNRRRARTAAPDAQKPLRDGNEVDFRAHS